MAFNLNSNSRDPLDSIPFSWNDSEQYESTETAVKVTTSQLRQLTKFGVFLWWSDQIPMWVHPDDIRAATKLVPGNRVFRRQECENSSDRKLGYSRFQYGLEYFRGQPALWLEVNSHGFEIGDLIEIKSQYGKLRPQIAIISSILWNRNSLNIEYVVNVNGVRIQRRFAIDELQPAIRLGKHLSCRELRLAARCNTAAESSRL